MRPIPRITLEEIGFTESEIIRLDTLVKYRDYEKSAKKLGKTANSLRAMTFRLRMRKNRAKTFLSKYEEYRRALGANCNYLNEK